MFTGIITDVVTVLKSRQDKGGVTLTLKKPTAWKDLDLGESIATNGVCLTVTDIRQKEYDCYIMPETMNVASFGFKIPKEVNLERSLSAKDRFGGHFVQGHVDGIGEVVSIQPGADYRLSIAFTASDDLLEALNPGMASAETQKTIQKNQEQAAQGLVMYKGSITIDGVSLTVADVKDGVLTVALIPHTLEHTTLSSLKPGDKVNLEFDMIGKYIANILEKRPSLQPGQEKFGKLLEENHRSEKGAKHAKS